MSDATTEFSGGIIGFKDEIAIIQSAISDFKKTGQTSNIAILSDPFSGKTTLINEIEKMNSEIVSKVSFSSIVKNKDALKVLDQSNEILIVDDCHFLYMRKIGGFSIIEDFSRIVTSYNKLFITTWNSYSWRYLIEIFDIDPFFPIQINLPRFTSTETKELLLSMYDMDQIKFVEDVDKKKIRSTPFSIFRKRQKAMTAENEVFEKIKQVSHGNPGVARIIWDKSLESQTIKPSQIKAFSLRSKPEYNEAFILSIILSMKSINKEELMEIIEPESPLDMILYKLSKEGLIAVDEERYSIMPEALYSIIDFLKKFKLVW